MSAATDKIKKYVGLASNALAYALQADTVIKSSVSETEPPVGSKDSYGNPMNGVMVGGISGTTILLALAVYYFFFRK